MKVNATGEVDHVFAAAVYVDGDVDAIADRPSRTIYVGGCFQVSITDRKLARAGSRRFPKPACSIKPLVPRRARTDSTDRSTRSRSTKERCLPAAISEASPGCGGDAPREIKTPWARSSPRLLARAGPDASRSAPSSLPRTAPRSTWAVTFTSYKGFHANHLAKVVAATATLDPMFNPQTGYGCSTNGFDGSVLALAIDPASKDDVYVGGQFGVYRGRNVGKVVRIEGDGSPPTTLFRRFRSPIR